MVDVFSKSYLKKIPLVSKANTVLKGSLQEHRARRALKHYKLKADQKYKRPFSTEILKVELARRLATRAVRRKPKGKLNIFLAYYVSTWESILPETLKPFGRVIAFNWREHGFDDTKNDWVKHRDKMNSCMLEAFLKSHKTEPVDVVIGYLSGYNTSPQTLLSMAESGAVIFNFCWDDKLNFPGKKIAGRYNSPASIAGAVDLNLTNSPESIPKYVCHNGLAMFWPGAGHPKLHRKHDIPFKYDVTFVGTRYGWRPIFINRLKKLGIKVECFGKGWPNSIVSNEKIIKIYSHSKINLGFAGIGYSKRLMCLKGRDFEIPMSGGLYLTRDNPELSLVYDVGKEILTYKNITDCAQIIRNLLVNPEGAETIRRAGRKRCLIDHTYNARWTEIFQLAGLLAEE